MSLFEKKKKHLTGMGSKRYNITTKSQVYNQSTSALMWSYDDQDIYPLVVELITPLNILPVNKNDFISFCVPIKTISPVS